MVRKHQQFFSSLYHKAFTKTPSSIASFIDTLFQLFFVVVLTMDVKRLFSTNFASDVWAVFEKIRVV